MHPPDPLPARGAGEWAPRRRLVKKPGVPAGGDCEILQVLLRVNERVFRPAGGRDGLSGCFAMFYVIQTASLTAWQFRRCRTCDIGYWARSSQSGAQNTYRRKRPTRHRASQVAPKGKDAPVTGCAGPEGVPQPPARPNTGKQRLPGGA